MSRSNPGYSVIASIFWRRKIHATLRAPQDLLDTEHCWCDGWTRVLEDPINGFDIEVVHRAGIKQQASDALSSLPTNGSGHTTLEDDIPVTAVARSIKRALNSPCIDAADGFHS